MSIESETIEFLEVASESDSAVIGIDEAAAVLGVSVGALHDILRSRIDEPEWFANKIYDLRRGTRRAA